MNGSKPMGWAASPSTISGLNTRRYHGLLIAATRPPVGRMVLLSKLEELLIVGDKRFELSANQYSGAIYPQGYQYQNAFRPGSIPVFTYEVGGVEIEKTVFMRHGKNTTVSRYRIIKSAGSVRLEVRPLVAFRDYHALTHENSAINGTFLSEPGLIELRSLSRFSRATVPPLSEAKHNTCGTRNGHSAICDEVEPVPFVFTWRVSLTNTVFI